MIGEPTDDDGLISIRADMEQLGMLAKEYVPVLRGLYEALIQAQFSQEVSEDLVKIWAERIWLNHDEE